MSEEVFDAVLGLTIEGVGSDGDNQFFIELSDGSEIEFTVSDNGELEMYYYKGFLDS